MYRKWGIIGICNHRRPFATAKNAVMQPYPMWKCRRVMRSYPTIFPCPIEENLFFGLKPVYFRLGLVPRFYIIPAGVQIFSFLKPSAPGRQNIQSSTGTIRTAVWIACYVRSLRLPAPQVAIARTSPTTHAGQASFDSHRTGSHQLDGTFSPLPSRKSRPLNAYLENGQRRDRHLSHPPRRRRQRRRNHPKSSLRCHDLTIRERRNH